MGPLRPLYNAVEHDFMTILRTEVSVLSFSGHAVKMIRYEQTSVFVTEIKKIRAVCFVMRQNVWYWLTPATKISQKCFEVQFSNS